MGATDKIKNAAQTAKGDAKAGSGPDDRRP